MMDINEDLYLNEALQQRAFMLQYLKSNEELLNDEFNELCEIIDSDEEEIEIGRGKVSI
jgi:hypothetical protein